MPCKASVNGKPCKCPTKPKAEFCFFHDPKRKEEAKIAREKSYLPRAVIPIERRVDEVKNLDELVHFLAVIANDVRSGELDEKKGQTVISACRELRFAILARDQHSSPEGIDEMSEEELKQELGLCKNN
jgi:hypothetical protein